MSKVLPLSMLLLAPSCCRCFFFVVGIPFTGVHDLGLVHDVASIHSCRCFLSVVGPTVTEVHALFLVHVFAGTHVVARFLLCWHSCIMLQHDVLAVDFSPSHARKKSSGPWREPSPMPEKSSWPCSEPCYFPPCRKSLVHSGEKHCSRYRGQTFLAWGNVFQVFTGLWYPANKICIPLVLVTCF